MAELDTSQKGGGKGKKGGHKTKKTSTRVDLTPMVDLAFLLVTFFMMTTTFSKPQTMELNLPIREKNVKEEEQQKVKDSHTMIIVLGADNAIYSFVGYENPDPVKTNYSKDGIRKLVQEKNASTKDLVVLIKPMEKSTYKNLVDILDEMSIANVKRYALVDVTPQDDAVIKKLL